MKITDEQYIIKIKNNVLVSNKVSVKMHANSYVVQVTHDVTRSSQHFVIRSMVIAGNISELLVWNI